MLKSRTTVLGALLTAALAGAAAAETFEIDAAHSEVGFKVSHMVVGRTKGSFGKFSGSFEFDGKDPMSWAAKAVIDAASIDTNNEDRDKHLRSPDFFDVEKHPAIEFVSTGVKEWKDGKGKLHGKLTMHGVTKPVVLELVSNGRATDPWGNDRAGFTARTVVDRRDYKILWNKDLDKGGLAVGNDVEITLEIEGIAKKPAEGSPSAQ